MTLPAKTSTPITLTGNVTQTGGGIVNESKVSMAPAIIVPKGCKLTLRNFSFTQTEWKASYWTCNRAIVIDGGEVELGNCRTINGYGIEVGAGGKLVWKGGGASGLQRYMVYAGLADNGGGTAKWVELQDLFCPGTRTEAVLRTEGCDKLIVRSCEFHQTDAAGRHDKGAIALRLVKSAMLINCDFDSPELGWRTPSNSDGAKKDAAYGSTHPNSIFLDHCRIRGQITNTGGTVGSVGGVAVAGGSCLGPDPRGFGSTVGLVEQTHDKYRGEIIQDMYQVPAGWTIGEGVMRKQDNPARFMAIYSSANAG